MPKVLKMKYLALLYGVLIRLVGVGIPVLQDSFCRIQPTELDEELVVLRNPFMAMPRTSLSGLGLRGPILVLVKMDETDFSLLTCFFSMLQHCF